MSAVASAPAEVQQPAQSVEVVSPSDATREESTVNGVEQLENGVKDLQLDGPELHRACAEGNLEAVRMALRRSREALEMLDITSGCTPIVLAIRNNHYDVVRELLQAGAIVPPPGLTNDHQMLSILYPQPLYSVPPFMPQQGMPEFFPQQPFYPNDRMFMPFPPERRQRKESDAARDGQPNLPPVDVAKSIPCRNFPNCKYGNNCVFFHPPRQGPFFGQQPGYGFEYQSFPQGMGYPQPGYQHPFQPPMVREGEDKEANPAPTESMDAPEPTSPLATSPLSPSALGASLPSIPPAEAFFAAASPPNFPPNGFNARRQSFNQFAVPPPPPPNGKPFGHAKRPSFSGPGPRPFVPGQRPALDFGKWRDGMPPPCAFFVQGKCRNGEMCKFPHLDQEGNDIRHPDVIRGAIPPMPPLGMGRQSRPPRAFPYDPSFKQQQLAFLQQQRAAVQNGHQQQGVPTPPSTDRKSPASDKEDMDGSKTLVEEVAPKPKAASERASPNPSLPAKPTVLPPPVPALARSASQPGVQRVHVNGFSSRSQSPAPSNVSLHGAGHPRRGGSRPPNGANNGQPNGYLHANGHSKSPVDRQRVSVPQSQRVPRADEFPVLAGTKERRESSESKQTSPVAPGRTAAQVLSAPAPEKPVVKLSRQESSGSQSPEGSITMDSDNDSDGVIISCKPSSATTPAASGTTSPAKRGSLSFATIASAITSPSEHSIAVKA